MLEKCVTKFRDAPANRQEKMVKEAANSIKGAWTEDMEFDRDTVIGVCELSAQLN
jgi:hypothetical protein